MIPERVFLAEHRDVMIGAVHSGPHQVSRARVHADVFLIDMLFMDRFGDQRAVGSQHKAAHLAVDRHISHALVAQDSVVNFLNSLADHRDIIRSIIGGIRYADAAGQVDESDMHVEGAVQFSYKFKQLGCQHRIILVSDSITCQESMDSEVLNTLFFEDPDSLEELLLREAVLGIAGVVHDPVGHPEDAAGIIAKAHGLREFTSQNLLQERNVRDIIQVDDSAEFSRVRVLLCRRIVGRKHDVISICPDSVGQHQLRKGRAVESEVIIVKDLHNIGIRRRLHGKIFTKSRIPGKRLFHRLRVLADSLFIIQIKGGGPFLRYLFCLLSGDIGCFFHDSSISRKIR